MTEDFFDLLEGNTPARAEPSSVSVADPTAASHAAPIPPSPAPLPAVPREPLSAPSTARATPSMPPPTSSAMTEPSTQAEPARRARPRAKQVEPQSGPLQSEHRRRRWGLLVAVVAFLLVVAGVGTVVWSGYGSKIEQALGLGPSDDYSGTGNGTPVVVKVLSGQIGADVAATLAKDGVTKTSSAFYKLLLKSPNVQFQPGSYRLQQQMSAKAALAALQDPKNRISVKVTIPEGSTAKRIYSILSTATTVPEADFESAANDPQSLGVPAGAKSVEGFLFPATYNFDPGLSATELLKQLVAQTEQHLSQLGVDQSKQLKLVTLASMVQREAGPNPDDLGKIARVFTNRLQRGMLLQSDATVAYGRGDTTSVWTTAAQRNDASNPYNTYVHSGLPVGPIGNPGLGALQAALDPTAGSWLYFVTVNLQTGETRFETTAGQHAADVRALQAWCAASAANAAYCK